MNMPQWERCNEKFDWFLDMLFEGKTVAINPYDYGDFLKYVQWSGLEKEFEHMERVDKETDDDVFPVVPEITLLDRKKEQESKGNLTKEQILEQMKDIANESDILSGFTCLGSIDKVYPDLPSDVLECYRTWIWEWHDKSFRMATTDYGNSHCGFVCEGTPEELIKHLRKC